MTAFSRIPAVPTLLAAALASAYSCGLSAETLHDVLTESRSFSEDTLVEVDGNFAVSPKANTDVVFEIAPEATLTILSYTTPEWLAEHPNETGGVAAVNVTHLPANHGAKLTFRGGSLVVERDHTSSPDTHQHVLEVYQAMHPVRFENRSVTLRGNAPQGAYVAYGSEVYFGGPLAVRLDRASLAYTSSTGAVAVKLTDRAFVEARGPVEVDLRAAPTDMSLDGILLQKGSSALFHDAVNLVFHTDGVEDKETFGVIGISAEGKFRKSSPEPVTFEGPVSMRHEGDARAPIRRFTGLTVTDTQVVTFSSGLSVDAPAARSVTGVSLADRSTLTVGSLHLSAPDADEACGVSLVAQYANDGPIFRADEVELLLPRDRTESVGIRVAGGNVHVTDRLLVSADTALVTQRNYYHDESVIRIERDFETVGPSKILAPAGRIAVNELGNGVVLFTGETRASDNGTISLRLGSDRRETSHWTAFPGSSLTTLQVGPNARLQFLVREETTGYDADSMSASHGAIVTVTGSEPVLLTDDPTSGVALLAARALQRGEVIELVASPAGFTLVAGGALLSADADLNAMKRPMLAVSRPSLASIRFAEVQPEDYDLHLEGSDLLVAEMLEDLDPSPKTEENDRLASLSASVLSAHGLLFSADDLLLDTLLGTNEASKRDGPFAAARAGRTGFDASMRWTQNAVTGLVGLEGRVAGVRSGVFLEFGSGHLNSRTGTKEGVVQGKGRHDFAGAGVFLDHPVERLGWTVTAYGKAGVLTSDFSAPLLGEGVPASDFERNALYWGAHLGAYRDVAIGRLTLRPFVAYHYEGLSGTSVRIAGIGDVPGATIRFGHTDAHRVRVGGLLSHPTGAKGRFTVGLDLEEVFGTRVAGRASEGSRSYAIAEENMDGLTGSVHLGWAKEGGARDLSYGFDLTASAGLRNGAAGNVRLLRPF